LATFSISWKISHRVETVFVNSSRRVFEQVAKFVQKDPPRVFAISSYWQNLEIADPTQPNRFGNKILRNNWRVHKVLPKLLKTDRLVR